MNSNSQRVTYDQAMEKMKKEYWSIPYPQLRTLAKEAGFIQGRGERCKLTLVEFLTENKFSKEFRGITHTMKLIPFTAEWNGDSWDRNPFMDLFGDDGSRFGDGTGRAKQFREKNSWAPKEVLDNICNTFLWTRWSSCDTVDLLTDCEEDEPEPPPRHHAAEPCRVSLIYDVFPARVNMEAHTIHPPPHPAPRQDTPIESIGKTEISQFNGTIYRSRWFINGGLFYEETMTIDKPGEYTFKWPWKNV